MATCTQNVSSNLISSPPSDRFPRGFLTKILYAFSFSPSKPFVIYNVNKINPRYLNVVYKTVHSAQWKFLYLSHFQPCCFLSVPSRVSINLIRFICCSSQRTLFWD